MKDDVVLNKIATIERCIHRIQEEYLPAPSSFRTNYTIQDSIVLNLQRACEAVIDLANYIIKKDKLGLPQSSRDAFDLLQAHHIIDEDLALRMKRMVGFRNMAVHEYYSLNLDIIESIIKTSLNDFKNFTTKIIQQP